ncbi:cell surface protein [Methanosarcina barkeri 227]|uniref:Cell surface protein n=1 Tax=Methanosarcina barkeri 227 TaxID=1434106 RepID=A0A0E3QZK5_METBA|nr:cell surface protein [Methanosarcina barkeri 227]
MLKIMKNVIINRTQNSTQNRIKNITKNGFLLSIFFILLFVFVGSASAQTIEVNPGADILTKIDEAQAGDVIYFNPGTYDISQNWNIYNKPLSFIGAGADKVTFNFNDYTDLNFDFSDIETAHDILIENISFSASTSPSMRYVSVRGSNSYSTNVIIRNCKINHMRLSSTILNNIELSNNTYISDSSSSTGNVYGKLIITENQFDNSPCSVSRINNGGVIAGNTFTNITSDYAFSISRGDDITFSDNVISHCTGGGLSINSYCDRNIITGNTFDSNSVGITFELKNGKTGTGNKIYHNNFINNTVNINDDSPAGSVQYVSDAVKYSYKNKSYTSSLGNYYSDYTGADDDNNGIGDTSYAFGSSSDTAPLMGKITVSGDNITIAVPPNASVPIADFTATPTYGDVPLTVNFTDASTGNVSSYSWDFDDDGTVDSTEQNPVYTYTAAGNYTVNLTVANADGNDSEVKTDYIVVSESLPGAPVANFTANVTSGIAPLDVQFTDASTGNVSSYSWDFDNDGTVDSTEQNPVYNYTAAGNYTVNLTVTGQEGSDSEVKTDYIVVSEPLPGVPVANFTANRTSGKAPLDVQFTDASIGNISSYSWDFNNDGTVDSTEQNPLYTYDAVGTYTVNLTVSNEDGNDSEVKTGYIKVSSLSSAKPVANFSVTPTSGKTPLNVKFTDASTGSPTSWFWNFGDGSKSYRQNPIHKYSKAGIYTVNLTVKNAKGRNTVTKTDYIKVITKPVANFSATPTSGKTPLKVTFADTSTGIPDKWIWDFGDGSKTFHQNPTHKYSKAGIYTVNLTVKNAKGRNTVTKTEYIKVITKPVANFTSSVTSGKAPLKVTFTDTSTGIPDKWIWDFGDGSKSYLQNPTHKYSKAGTYAVNLTVKNAKGRNTITKTEYIKVV